jgi:nitrate reductase delta subunit
MHGSRELFETLSTLVGYPGANAAQCAHSAMTMIEAQCPVALGDARTFADAIATMRRGEIEEWYTRTFDLNPDCSLDLGWHIYGEQYARGTFLVRMRQTLREAGIAESTDLPDHLSRMLELFGRTDDPAVTEIAQTHVIPALDKIIGAIKPPEDPYLHLLCAVRTIVASRYPTPIEAEHHG